MRSPPPPAGARDIFRPFLRHFEPIPANFRFTSGLILARWVPFDASHQYESNGGLPSRIGPPEPELASNSGQLPVITRALLEMAMLPTSESSRTASRTPRNLSDPGYLQNPGWGDCPQSYFPRN